ncbi:Aste57867_14834 [Aphanomyces stellatus]|uniref:Aste57867_14834 protein n=1 Tax=Aphanomyces stellatus TaxID=120398 RepID=A0A485L2N7_9STRA|nr:hypothetical protein As57867_014778 [Aphanomyces stellatus]VFT91652.1 Aste57867_14834 [Aphanomyces stellatus]
MPTRVHPRPTPLDERAAGNVPTIQSYDSSHRRIVLGSAYLVVSMLCSTLYLTQLEPAFANAIWWRGYNASGHQALVMDLVNSFLATHSAGALDLLGPTATMDKNYASPRSTTAVHPSYVRRLIYNELTSLEFAIMNLRAMDALFIVSVPTQYCWVDLDRQFQVAHTDARQARCERRYRANGAMYMETVLRNQDWTAFMTAFGGPNGAFTTPILAWLNQVPEGQRWLAQTAAASTTIDEEALYWRARQVTSFALQWHNGWQAGMTETLQLENALGLPHALHVKNIPQSVESWTSQYMYWSLVNDLIAMNYCNCSLIRAALNSYTVLQPLFLESSLGVQDPSGNFIAQVALFRAVVGPFNAVDLTYVVVPPLAMELYHSFQTSLYTLFRSHPNAQKTMDSVTSNMVLTPTPQSWTTMPDTLFYGGNPMCLYGLPQPYVQETFSFYDTCATQPPLRVLLTPTSTIFTALAMQNATEQFQAACNLAIELEHCHRGLTQAMAFASSIPSVAKAIAPLIQSTVDAVTQLNVGMMQFSSNGNPTGTWTLLQQPLLDESAWSMYGWICLFDWIEGRREVVSFEGDVSTVVVVSAADTLQLYSTTRESIPVATVVVAYLMVYITTILVVVSLVCLLCMLWHGCRIHGQNLLWFNRVVGSIWVGRPLLLARGVTAILLLSTSQLELTLLSTECGTPHSRFEFLPRSGLATLVVAGEATWVLNVAHDFCVIFTGNATVQYAPVSAWLAWICIVGLEFAMPVMPRTLLVRRCVSENMSQAIHCTVGSLTYGNFERIVVIFTIQAIALVLPIVLLSRIPTALPRCQPPSAYNRHVLGVADTFLISSHEPTTNHWAMDNTSCIMAGLIPLVWRNVQYTFDLKLWAVHADAIATNHFKTFEYDKTGVATKPEKMLWPTTTPLPMYKKVFNAMELIVGVAYVGLAIFGSISYLQVSQVNLANDMFWANFNMTGAHAFMANWFNSMLVLGASNMTLQLNNDTINMDGPFDQLQVSIQCATNYGSLLQYSELNAIEIAIPAIRSTDGCTVPWIFTQYCFVDFNQQWEMANSQARQTRCHAMTHNGAVFLESMLRNVRFREFYNCWGNAFDIGLANELRRTTSGQLWLTSISSDIKLPLQDEIALWTAHNIATFATQWQNYKQIGLVNSYAVTNGYGGSSQFTLQYQNASFRFPKQTTFKMYWGLANDFVAVMQNTSSLNGQSLIASSPTFAFANTTLESVLIQNGTLESPLANVFTIMQSVVGPFGAVDMYFIPCPERVKSAVRDIFLAVRGLLSHGDDNVVDAFNQLGFPSAEIAPAPKAWTDLNFYARGGSPVCPEVSYQSSPPVSAGLAQLLAWNYPCTTMFQWTMFNPSSMALLASAMLANTTVDDIEPTCAQNIANEPACVASLTHTLWFLDSFLQRTTFSASVTAANVAVTQVGVEVAQFGGDVDPSVPLTLHRMNVLDPSQREFTYFAWLFLLDWAQGFREAVSFEGDMGTMAILTEYLSPTTQQVNFGENTTNLSFYLRSVVLYVTYAMLGLASLTLVYIFICRGHVELRNLLFLERVGGIVWIGRPFLFMRSVSALILLSTCPLQLAFNGHLSYFEVAQDPWYKTLLAANEVSWLVSIVNDVAASVTGTFTAKYTGWDSVLVLVTAVVLSFVAPLSHSVALSKQCQLVQMDAQVVCNSGVVEIGRMARVALLCSVVLGWTVLCYVIARVYYRLVNQSSTERLVESVFLYSGARFQFRTARWIHHDTYYLDRMSAVLNGILTIHWDHAIVGLDVKLWRLFRVEICDEAEYSRHEARTTLPIHIGLPDSVR